VLEMAEARRNADKVEERHDLLSGRIVTKSLLVGT